MTSQDITDVKKNPSFLYLDTRKKKCFEGISESGHTLSIAGRDHEKGVSLEGISSQKCQVDCFSVTFF